MLLNIVWTLSLRKLLSLDLWALSWATFHPHQHPHSLWGHILQNHDDDIESIFCSKSAKIKRRRVGLGLQIHNFALLYFPFFLSSSPIFKFTQRSKSPSLSYG